MEHNDILNIIICVIFSLFSQYINVFFPIHTTFLNITFYLSVLTPMMSKVLRLTFSYIVMNPFFLSNLSTVILITSFYTLCLVLVLKL